MPSQSKKLLPSLQIRQQQIWSAVQTIPQGRVSAYGDVAAMVGRPGAARHVGYALAALPAEKTVPWWRVIRSDGSIAMGGDPSRGMRQEHLLRTEGVIFRGRKVDMRRMRWRGPLLASILHGSVLKAPG